MAFYVVLFYGGNVGANVYISHQTLGKMGDQISHFRSYFQNMKTIFMFRM